MEQQFKEVHVGGISLAYVEQGQGEPIIFVHGAGPTDLRTWGLQMEPFAAHHRAIAYSQRYHYPNPWIDDGSEMYSTLVHTSDLAALIAALRLGPVHLVGNSYGSDIVLRLAVERPDLVRTLVLEEAGLHSWLVTLPNGQDLFAEMVATILPAKRAVQNGDLEDGVRLFADAALGRGLFDQLPTATKKRFMDNARLIGPLPTDANEVTAITRQEATMIQAPTLLLTGDQSPEMYLLATKELARYLPNVEQAEISSAAHVLHYMNAQAFNETVLAFLAKHSG